MLLSGSSPFVILFPSLRSPIPILLGLFQAHQLQLVSPSPSSYLPTPTLCNIVILWLDILIMGGILRLYQDQGVVYDLRAWHWCDQEQLWWLYINNGSQKNGVYEALSFILLNSVIRLFLFCFWACIAFIVYIYRPILGLFLLRLIIFIDKIFYSSDDSAVKLKAGTVYRVSISVSIIDFSALNLTNITYFRIVDQKMI